MGKLVIASHNRGKAQDLARFFESSAIELSFAYEIGIPDIAETGITFEENAILKARYAATYAREVALADDSGLCIPSWNNQPGVGTKRFAMSKGGWQKGIQALKPFAERCVPAQFYCALALAWSELDYLSVLGSVNGFLVWPPRGEYGSGFDSIFSLTPNGKRLAEFPVEQREQINHRANAFLLLQEYINIEIDGIIKRASYVSQSNLG